MRTRERASSMSVGFLGQCTLWMPHEAKHYLLASREVRDVLPALLRRHHAENDTLGEGIHAVDQF